MVDAGLTPLGAGVARTDDADQGPSAFDLGHEGAAGIALAGVLASLIVARAHHLVVDDNVNPVGSMPPLANAIVYYRNVHRLQSLWPQSRTCGKWQVLDFFRVES